MPTNIKVERDRLNISIVKRETISELYSLRDELEDRHSKGTRLSIADVIEKLLKARPSLDVLMRY